MLLIGDIMTSNPYTLRADNSLTDARVLMAQHRIGTSQLWMTRCN
ncbi:hypothetical protein PCI56_14060 [Plesiomonas shigelloides subsp. oncorhynchi]|nr:hypothetical protein [Plesiomonas shigelloides]